MAEDEVVLWHSESLFISVILQPPGLDELTMERVQDDVEIETEGQSDAFAVSLFLL